MEGQVPNTNKAANASYLRESAVNFRRLAEDHGKAGNHQISAKMTEVATDFEVRAAELETNSQAAA